MNTHTLSKKNITAQLIILIGIVFSLGFNSCSIKTDTINNEIKLSNPNPSKEAVAVYRYLNDMKGKVILSGQMWAPWGIDEIEYVYNITGKYPAIRGQDLITETENDNEIRLATEWWKKGGIPTIMWHWGAPSVGEGYPNSQAEINIENCFIEGTTEYNEMWRELKVKATHLEKLRDANVPILWRPFHELNGHWFWYGKQGSENFKKLWKTMYNYYVHERGLNNLIWVFCHTGDANPEWYPGDEFVDMAGPDTYALDNSPQTEMFINANQLNTKYPLPFHECGIPPNPDQCLAQNAMWSWWMQWHTSHLQHTDTTYLKYVYNHSLIITLDEVPDIMALYSWDSKCKPSDLSARIKVDQNEWGNNNTIMFDDGESAVFEAKSNNKGQWKWSGYGTSGNNEQQKVTLGTKGSALAMFTNDCGATSSLVFNVGEIREPCQPTPLAPMMKIGNGEWSGINKATVKAGEIISFGPHPVHGGNWRWEGGTSGNTREKTFEASVTTTITAIHTNFCGTESYINFEIIVEQ